MKKKIVLIFIVFLVISCQRNETPLEDNPLPIDEIVAYYGGILNEYVLVNQIFQDVVNNTGDAMLNAEGIISGELAENNLIPNITVEPSDMETFPKTVKVDFGSGKLCRDGIVRRGVINIVSTGWFWEKGSVQTISFSNYYHDTFKVEGTQIIDSYGIVEDTLIFAVEVLEGIVSTTDGVNISFEENSIREWIVGSQTPLNIWDDEYILDAFQYGVSADGTDYILVFDEPLHFDLLPRKIKSGIIDLQIGNVSDIEINYNNKTTTILGVTNSWN